METGVAGFYSFYLNGELVHEAPSKNLLLTAGRTYLMDTATSNTATSSIMVGTGTTPPALGDTTLVAQVAQVGVNAAWGSASGTDGIGTYTALRHTGVFAQGAVVGNIAEVGWRGVASGSLHSRSLVQDAMGSPTTLTVTAIDQLTVVFELRIYNGTATGAGTVVIAGVTYNWTSSAVTYLGLVTGSAPTSYLLIPADGRVQVLAAGTNASFGALTRDYVNSTVTWTINLTTAQGNSGSGITSFVIETANNAGLGRGSRCTVTMSPAIPKLDTMTFSATFKMQLVWP